VKLSRLTKTLFAITLLTALFLGVDWEDLFARIDTFGFDTLAIAFLAVVGQFAVGGSRWWWSLRLHGLLYPLRFIYKVLFIGFFFNNFLPSAIGGDAYRIYRTTSPSGQKLRSISAVFVERVVGLGVMLALGLVGAVYVGPENALARAYMWLSAAGTVAALLVAVAHWMGWFTLLGGMLRKHSWFSALESNALYVLRLRFEWIPVVLTSLAFQVLAALILYVLFAGAGDPMSLAACMLIAAAAGLASVVPFSLNGIGIVEGSIAGTAVALGANYDSALLVAIALRLVVLPANAMCGLVYLFERQSLARAEGEIDLTVRTPMQSRVQSRSTG
jgi:uncharacterized membrane protein YbhN (UPF0104 family)